MLIKEIQKKVQVKEKEVSESMDDFTDFLSFKKNYIVEHVDYLTEEEDGASFDKFIDAIESVDKEEKSEKTSAPSESEKDRNLYISPFQPFDNTDLKVIGEMYRKNKQPTVLCLVHPEAYDQAEFPISKETCLQMLEEVKEGSNEIGEIIHVKKAFLGSVLDKCKEHELNPVLLGASLENSDMYQKQLDYLKAQDRDLDLSVVKFKMPKRDKNLLGLISQGDYTLFKKYIPSQISAKFFQILQNEINQGSHNLEN
jgi:hypothetical protein